MKPIAMGFNSNKKMEHKYFLDSILFLLMLDLKVWNFNMLIIIKQR